VHVIELFSRNNFNSLLSIHYSHANLQFVNVTYTSIIVRKFESVRWIHRKSKIHALENMIEEKVGSFSYVAL